MPVSIHTYTAALVHTPSNIPLDIKGGSVKMDARAAPYISGTLSIAIPTLATLNLLDPRLGKRLSITLARTNPAISVTYNVLLTRRSIAQEDFTVELSFSSDEQLLMDFRPSADDDTPISLGTSLRDVVDYVLDAAIPGAALAASPSTDADVHATWEVTNLHTNPEIVNTYGYGIGSGASSPTRVTFGSVAAVRWTATMSDSVLVPTPSSDSFRVRQGHYYVFTIELLNGTAPRLAQLGIQWYAGAGTAPMQTLYGPAQTGNMVTWTTYHIIARAPVGAQSMVPLVFTYGNVPGDYQYAKRVMVYEGDRVVPAFAGGFADDADYQYSWTDSADGSPSIREPLNDTPTPDALTWKAGTSAFDFLWPLVQAAGLRLVCNESRTWQLRNDAYRTAFSYSGVAYAIDMTGGEDALDRDNDAWFDGAVTVYKWTDRDGIAQEMVDAYTPGTPTKIRLFEKTTPYPGPGFSQYAVERAARRGRELTVSKVADFYATPDMALTVTPYLTAAQAAVMQSVTFDLDSDEMTIVTRQAT